jgi:hypothetical protein
VPYEALQIPSLTLFEQTPLDQLLSRGVADLDSLENHNRMSLFGERRDTTEVPALESIERRLFPEILFAQTTSRMAELVCV